MDRTALALFDISHLTSAADRRFEKFSHWIWVSTTSKLPYLYLYQAFDLNHPNSRDGQAGEEWECDEGSAFEGGMCCGIRSIFVG